MLMWLLICSIVLMLMWLYAVYCNINMNGKPSITLYYTHYLYTLFTIYIYTLIHYSKIQFVEEKSRVYVSSMNSNSSGNSNSNGNSSGNISNSGDKDVQCVQYAYTPLHIQLVGLSATVGNINAISEWFGCNSSTNSTNNASSVSSVTRHAPYVSTFRPIELVEYIVEVKPRPKPSNKPNNSNNSSNSMQTRSNKLNSSDISIGSIGSIGTGVGPAVGVVYSSTNTLIRELNYNVGFEEQGLFGFEEYITVHLALECVSKESQQVLVFCGTRYNCQSTCQSVVKYYDKLLKLYRDRESRMSLISVKSDKSGQSGQSTPQCLAIPPIPPMLNGNLTLTRSVFEQRVRIIDELLREMVTVGKYEIKTSNNSNRNSSNSSSAGPNSNTNGISSLKPPCNDILLQYSELCSILSAEFVSFPSDSGPNSGSGTGLGVDSIHGSTSGSSSGCVSTVLHRSISILNTLKTVEEFIVQLSSSSKSSKSNSTGTTNTSGTNPSGFCLSDLQLTLLCGIVYGVCFHHAG